MDLIIGAGISGLSYASFCGHSDFLIVEKESEPGGYCRTIKKDGYIWDYSGHFFHFRDEELKEFLLANMNRENVLKVKKHSQIKVRDFFVDFPFQLNIHQLSKDELIDCLYDLFINPISDETSFKRMLYSKYGKSISEIFLIPYNQKLYACDLDMLDPAAMGRFFPHANKEEIILNFKKQEIKNYNTEFLYPRGGAVEYVKSLLSHVKEQNLVLGEKLIKINSKEKYAVTSRRQIKYDRIISTIPLPELYKAVGTSFDDSIYNWNKVLVLNLGFDKKGRDHKNNWIYFHEKDYCFYRVGFYDNILQGDRMSLYIEISGRKEEELIGEKYLPRVLYDLKKAGIVSDQKLVSFSFLVMDPAYVHINTRSEKDKIKKIEQLNHQDIFSIGRYGAWKYCSIEDNMCEARELAHTLNSANLRLG
jgi:protoporphyrinogen oxidase